MHTSESARDRNRGRTSAQAESLRAGQDSVGRSRSSGTLAWKRQHSSAKAREYGRSRHPYGTRSEGPGYRIEATSRHRHLDRILPPQLTGFVGRGSEEWRAAADDG